MSDGFKTFITAPERDRLDIFLAASRRLGAALPNIEKDFWVSWTLNILYHGLPSGSPRLLFKGGTSLSKAHDLIRRFSEDIDITVFREDLNQAASIEEMEKLSGKKRRAKLDAIRDACHAWVTGPLRENLATQIQEDGYALDSGSPNSLWFGLPGCRADDPFVRGGINRQGLLRQAEEEFASAF